jgi:hypothetical protein
MDIFPCTTKSSRDLWIKAFTFSRSQSQEPNISNGKNDSSSWQIQPIPHPRHLQGTISDRHWHWMHCGSIFLQHRSSLPVCGGSLSGEWYCRINRSNVPKNRGGYSSSQSWPKHLSLWMKWWMIAAATLMITDDYWRESGERSAHRLCVFKLFFSTPTTRNRSAVFNSLHLNILISILPVSAVFTSISLARKRIFRGMVVLPLFQQRRSASLGFRVCFPNVLFF